MKKLTLIIAVFIAFSSFAQTRIFPTPSVDVRESLAVEGTLRKLDNGVWKDANEDLIFLSSVYCSGIYGYNHEIPVYLLLSPDGVIKNIALGENRETPKYMDMILDADFFANWYDKNVKEFAVEEVEAVSGATISSNAIIKTINTTIENIKASKFLK